MSERVTLTEAERMALGGPDSPWVRDDWDGLLHTVERILTDRLAAATADYERRLDHAHDDHLRLRAALAAEPTWVCDTCMLRVHRDQIAVWADGEHVVCQWCRQADAEVEALRATVGRVEALHQRGELRPMKPWCRECGQHYPCPTVRALGGGPS